MIRGLMSGSDIGTGKKIHCRKCKKVIGTGAEIYQQLVISRVRDVRPLSVGVPGEIEPDGSGPVIYCKNCGEEQTRGKLMS